MRILFVFLLLLKTLFLSASGVAAISPSLTPVATGMENLENATPSATLSPEPIPSPRPDITQRTEETLGPLEKLLTDQQLGSVLPFNFIKYAIRGAVAAGVPANTIVLLLLLPGVAALIAATRHLIGLRGFGIFLPAALSVVFVATGPIVGIALFLVIVLVSILIRFILRKSRIKLQYLPRMALLLQFVVLGILGILFTAPFIRYPDLANVSIFPVLVLVLLAEDFSRVQLGKSAKVAINLTTETLILALFSFMFLTYKPVQQYALLNPELFILSILLVDFVMGKYVGLRLMEYWRFRKLIKR